MWYSELPVKKAMIRLPVPDEVSCVELVIAKLKPRQKEWFGCRKGRKQVR